MQALSNSQIFYIKYLTMYKVHMHAGVIRKLCVSYCLCVCTGENQLAKARLSTRLSSRTYVQTIQ